jgi:hypothetical protein
MENENINVEKISPAGDAVGWNVFLRNEKKNKVRIETQKKSKKAHIRSM